MAESIVETAKKRAKLAWETYGDQANREIEDLRFQVNEEQWDSVSKQQRGSVSIGNYAIPARPMLSVPMLNQPIQLVYNQAASAHLGVNVHPLSEDANKDTAEVIQGLYRKIERDSRASIARLWAFDRASKCGRGAYRVNVKYDDYGGNPFDLKITIERILYQQDVYFDPSAQEPDWSDGQWAFLFHWVALDEFKRKYPKATIASSSDWNGMLHAEPEWVRGDGDQKAVLVAEYYCKEYVTEKLYLLSDGSIVTDKADIPSRLKVVRERERETCKVMWYTLTGVEDEPLDSEEWNGRFIPLIPVIGKELQPYEGERRWEGIIRPAMGAQKFYNFSASSLVERMALEPKAPFIADPRQIEGYEAFWQNANTRNFPFLPYNAQMVGSQVLPPPARMQVENTGMSISVMGLQEARDFIQSTTFTYDPSLGKFSSKDRSGRAILANQNQSDAANSHYLTNLADISMTYEAMVVIDLMRTVYERPGRIAEILTGEDETKTVMLNQPYLPGPDGMPRPVPMAGPDGRSPQMGPTPQHHDLVNGTYGVSVSIGKSYQTRLEQGADEIGQMLQASPELMMTFGDIYMRFRDIPGAKEMADRLKAVIEQVHPGITKRDDGTVDPQQLQAQNQALQQQAQQMQQMLQKAGNVIQTKQVEKQADLQGKQVDAETRVKVAEINAQAGIIEAQIKAGNEQILAKMKSQDQAIQEVINALREQRLQGHEAAHEVALQAHGHEHAVALEAQKMRHEKAMGALTTRVAADQAATKAEPQADGAGE